MYLQLPEWMRPWIQFSAPPVAPRQPHQPWYLIKPLPTESRIMMTGVQRLETGYKNFHDVQPKIPDHWNRTVHNNNLISTPREPIHNHAQLFLNLTRFAGAIRVHPILPVWTGREEARVPDLLSILIELQMIRKVLD